MQKINRARLMLLFSMAIFGTLAPFVRSIPVSSGELALYRAVLAIAVLLLFFLLTRHRIAFSAVRPELFKLLLSGASMGFNWILLFEAYRYTTVAAATLSYYFAPVIVTILSPILFREKLTAKQIVCFAASTVGLALVIGVTDLGRGGNDLVGILFGLGAAALYATVILLNKSIRQVTGIERTFFQFAAAILVLLPYVLLSGGIHLGGIAAPGWISLLIVGLLHTGITYCLYFTALRDLPGQEAAILSYVDPLVAVVVSVTILGEPLTLPQLIGGLLILGFTLANEIHLKKKS